MKLLAIESSGLVASAAIATETTLLAEYTVNFKKTHSQTLLPMVDEIVRMTGLDLKEIDAIAVSAGPGSFTGLRIGSATAKGLGLALDKPVVPVPTTQGIAANLYGVDGIICPLMDARRNQVYTGVCTFEKDKFEVVKEQEPMEIDVLLEELTKLYEKEARDIVFLGDGVPVFTRYINEKLEIPHFFAPAHLNRQRASSVATLGAKYYEEGKYVKAQDFVPIYLRQSQAEMSKEGNRV